MSKNYSGTSINVQKLFWNIYRTCQEQACHNQKDDGETWLPELEGL